MNKHKLILSIFTILAIAGTIFFMYPFENENLTQTAFNSFEEEEESLEKKRIFSEERAKHEFKLLKNPLTGKVPRGAYLESVQKALKVTSFKFPSDSRLKTLPTIAITERGPDNYGGRTRALGFDVRNTNIVLAGGVTSGILRSIDGGANWTRVTPTGTIHSVTCLAQDTRSASRDTWYAGTGEVETSASQTGASFYGHGIYKSTDNGLTWTALASTQGDLESFDEDFDFVNRIVVNPNNGDVLVMASNAIQRSTDGGSTWTLELGSGQELRGDIIYNSVGSKFYAAINCDDDTDGGIYSSPDGDVWTRIRTEAQLSSGGVGRIVLANVANTTEIVALCELKTNYNCTNSETTKAGLVHFDGTSTWTDHTDYIGDCASGYTTEIDLQGEYNMALTTKPDDADIVFLGGVEAYRYNMDTEAYDFIGGSQEAANGDNLHVDQHIFMFEPGSNNMMWVGNDGGLSKVDVTSTITANSSSADGYNWTPRVSGYNGYQYYGVDIDPADGSDFLAGGAQDNAFTIQPTNATAKELGGGDGVDIAVISGSANFTTHKFFAMSQNGDFDRTENGVTGASINPSKTAFVGMLYLDADNTNYLYFPASDPNDELYRTRIAETINAKTVTGNSDSGWENMTGVNGAISNPISALDASRDIEYGGDYSASDSDRKLYIGTEGGKVFRLNDPAFASAGTVPVEITPTGMSGGGYVSDIAVNPLDDNEIIVTYSNYNVNSIWHTSDASVASPTWTNIDGPTGTSVELASIRCALITSNDGTDVYIVGTSTGLYGTTALSGATTSWTRIGMNEIGLAVCVDMRLRTSDNKVALGTHGNGMFMLDFPGSLPVELINFAADVIKENDVVLGWSTASEVNNRGFEVQRSADGQRFETLDFVNGVGNTTEEQSYSYTDKNLSSGQWYYRIKQIDFDGKFEYSKTISVRIEEAQTQLGLFPNPVAANLTISEGRGTVAIYDIKGKKVREFLNNASIRIISVEDLPNGIYIIQVTGNDGMTTSKRFIKQ